MTKKSLLLHILAWAACLPLTAANDYRRDEPMYASRWRDYQRSTYFGLRFGLNIPTIRYQGTGGIAQTDPHPRFHLGLVCGNKLGNGLPFYIESGLMYTEKGAEFKETQDEGFRKTTLRYLEVPVVLKYKVNTNVDDLSVQPFFGGYLALGVGGEVKDYRTKEKHDPFGSSRYKRFDAGLKVGCGLAYQNFYFSLGYDIGLFNIAGNEYTDYHYDSFDGRIRTGNFTMSVGVDF